MKISAMAYPSAVSAGGKRGNYLPFFVDDERSRVDAIQQALEGLPLGQARSLLRRFLEVLTDYTTVPPLSVAGSSPDDSATVGDLPR